MPEEEVVDTGAWDVSALPDDSEATVAELPQEVIETFMAAFNASIEAGDDEETAVAAGWDAVRQLYEQDADGNWVPIAETSADVDESVYVPVDDTAYDPTLDMSEGTVALTDLADPVTAGKPVEFLRVGKFTDMSGKAVNVTGNMLDALIANFQNNAAGQDVPIDVLHARAEAAGWIKRIWRDGERLLAEVSWNKFGEGLIKDRLYRYLSATIDLGKNVLRAISLVNFPSIKGLQPVELSEKMFVYGKQEGTVDGKLVTKAKAVVINPDGAGAVTSAMLSEVRAQITAQLQEQFASEMKRIKENKSKMFADFMAQAAEENRVVQLSEQWTGEGKHALPVKASEIESFLRSLSASQRAQAETILTAVVQYGTVDFSERGTARGGVPRTLAPAMKAQLRSFVKNGGSVNTFFEANSDTLGEMQEYNLTEFSKG